MTSNTYATKPNPTDEQVTIFAEQTCEGLQDIIHKANLDLEKTFYGDNVKQQLRLLRKCPAQARVIAEHEDTGNRIELYICPNTPPVGDYKCTVIRPKRISDLTGRQYASYYSPLGQMASMSSSGICQGFHIIERALLNPCYTDDLIDSYDTEVDNCDLNIYTIRSLREVLKATPQKTMESESWLDETSAPTAPNNIVKGAVRKVIATFGQQNIIVNAEQDAIARSPIDTKYILLGAAGTGKTTTLSHRLQCKMYQGDYGIPKDERDLINACTEKGMPKKWLLFTPTELLKQYVRNALDNRGLGSTNQQIVTWQDFSLDIARDKLGFLASPTNKGGLILNTSDTSHLNTSALSASRRWFEDFRDFYHTSLISDFRAAVNVLCVSTNESAQAIGIDIKNARLSENNLVAALLAKLDRSRNALDRVRLELRESSKQEILAMAKNCARHIENLQQIWTEYLQSERINDEEEEVSDDVAESTVGTEKVNPAAELKNTIRRYCQYVASNRKITAESRLGKRLTLLSDGLPEKKRAESLGKTLNEIKAIRRLYKAFDTCLTSIPAYYRAFRKNNLSSEQEMQWYSSTPVKARQISQEELDLILLLHFQTINRFYNDNRISVIYRDRIRDEMMKFTRMMIFIDECTDFSSIQLAAMHELAFPDMRSVFACGDFNQRLTKEGVSLKEDLEWAIPGADIRLLKTSYRQTRKLHSFCNKLLSLIEFNHDVDSHTNEKIEDSGVAPALLENGSTLLSQVAWTAKRIIRMQRHYKENLPTTAIFVPTKQDVAPMAEMLAQSSELIENNLKVQACPDGQAVSADTKIGVYPIELVKGLEFEACFFLSVDVIAKQDQELFERLLYVGATRAAYYLGLVCEATLPSRLEDLRNEFVSDWP